MISNYRRIPESHASLDIEVLIAHVRGQHEKRADVVNITSLLVPEGLT